MVNTKQSRYLLLQQLDKVKLISSFAAFLVAFLAIGAFTLSYTSLQHLARVHGIDPGLTWLWPLLLDFAMIVFSLAVLRANLRSCGPGHHRQHFGCKPTGYSHGGYYRSREGAGSD